MVTKKKSKDDASVAGAKTRQKRGVSDNKSTWVVAVIVVLIVIVSVMIIIGQLRKISANDLEKDMTSMVSKYFDENIRGKVIGINKQIVTVETLERAGYDIKNLKDPNSGTACDKVESFSYVVITDPAETDYDKISYSVENHLTCDEYSSNKQ